VKILTSLLQQIVASREGVVLEEFIPIILLKRLEADDLKKRQGQSSIDTGEEATCQSWNYL
jgi:hypothetical protein